MVKNPPPMLEMRVRSLGQEDLLKKERQPIPVLLSGKSLGQEPGPWVHGVAKELNMT